MTHSSYKNWHIKGRKAAISEATAAGFPVYGPGSILSAFPEWDKVKALFGALRARYIRRQMHLKQRMSGKKNFESDEYAYFQIF